MIKAYFILFKKFAFYQFLIIVGAFLFFLSFPNPFFKKGLSWIAFFSFIPVFFVVKKASFKVCFISGGLYGAFCIGLINYYNISYGIQLFSFLIFLWFCYYALLFIGLKSITLMAPVHCYLFQPMLWVVFEYLKTLGFLGYPYGISAYSQYSFIELIQISSFTGIWGISFLIIFPASILGNALSMYKAQVVTFSKSSIIPIFLFIVIFISVYIYGRTVIKDSFSHTIKIAAVQHHDISFLNRESSPSLHNKLTNLIRLSEKALLHQPTLIVWPEGAFDSAITWYYRYKLNDNKKQIEELNEFLSHQSSYFLIGNFERAVTQNVFGERTIGEYNSSLLFHKDNILATYRKTHLVPFGENFPFEKEFPGLYTYIKNHHYTRFFIKGGQSPLMEIDNIKFSPIICFEDSFSDISGTKVKQGADLIINQTSDSHAYSPVASYHHMNMALFRSVENRRSMLRATNYGITCVISPYGKVLAEIPFGKEGILVYDIPLVNDELTFYTKHGDWLIVLFAAILIGIIIFLAIYSIIIYLKKP